MLIQMWMDVVRNDDVFSLNESNRCYRVHMHAKFLGFRSDAVETEWLV
jgi:hypothetical protein